MAACGGSLLPLLLLCSSLLWILSPAKGKEVTITCVNSEDCVLPCRFQSDGQGARIMWYRKKTVVSCTRYGNTSFVVGHNSPAPEYKGRTRLYADQVLKGNATLILKNIRPEDQGRYICLTMTALQTESAAINVNIRVADAVVSCVFMESCILPCSFQGGTDVVVHWIKEALRTPVHSYYHNQDQLVAQGQRFRGRTSLFQDQISRGNASLQLTGVKVQDQGLYQCYTSTETAAEKTFINLKVNALIREVYIQQEGNRITCRSEGIYPEPELTWSTNPPSTLTPDKPTVQQTEQQLYNINSSLVVSDGVTGLDYSCTVSTDRSRRTATLSKPSKPIMEIHAGYFIMGVIGAISLVVMFACIVALLCKRKKGNKKMQEYASSEPEYIRREETEMWLHRDESTYLGSERHMD